MSTEAKKNIQNSAWDLFPAQELWIRNDDCFWAFEVNDEEVIFTDGEYRDGKISFHCTVHPTRDGERYVDSFAENKRLEGFECFATQLRNN